MKGESFRVDESFLCQDGGVTLTTQAQKFLHWGPSRPFPMYFFIWLFIHILHNTSVIVSKGFSSVPWAILADNQSWGGGLGNPQFSATLDRSVGNMGTNNLWLMSEMRGCPVELSF